MSPTFPFLPRLLSFNCYIKIFCNKHSLKTSNNEVRWNLDIQTNEPIDYLRARIFVKQYYKKLLEGNAKTNCDRTVTTERKGERGLKVYSSW